MSGSEMGGMESIPTGISDLGLESSGSWTGGGAPTRLFPRTVAIWYQIINHEQMGKFFSFSCVGSTSAGRTAPTMGQPGPGLRARGHRRKSQIRATLGYPRHWPHGGPPPDRAFGPVGSAPRRVPIALGMR